MAFKRLEFSHTCHNHRLPGSFSWNYNSVRHYSKRQDKLKLEGVLLQRYLIEWDITFDSDASNIKLVRDK
jgi:hypothetical protein